MQTNTHQFYKTLLLLIMGVTMFSIQLRQHSGALYFPLLPMLVFFVLLSQFYLGRWELKLFSIALLIGNGIFLDQILQEMIMFHSSTTTELAFRGVLNSLIYLVPTVYFLLKIKLWYSELTSETKEIVDSKQQYYVFLPFVVIGIIELSNQLFQFPDVSSTSKFSTESLLALFSNADNQVFDFANLFELRTLRSVIILYVLFITRKNIHFGYFILSYYVIKALLWGVSNIIISQNNEVQVAFFSKRELVTNFFLPIIGLVLYWMYFKSMHPFKSFRINRENEVVDLSQRPFISISDFKERCSSLLKNEAVLILLIQVFFGVYLIFLELQPYSKSGATWIFGLISIALVLLFYIGVRKQNFVLALVGFILTSLFTLGTFVLSIEFDPLYLVDRQIGAFIIVNLLVIFIVGIPILKSLYSDDYFVSFIQNRDHSRIYNRKPNYQFDNLDVIQAEIDNYSDELIPWKIRKRTILIIFTIQSLALLLSLNTPNSITEYGGLFTIASCLRSLYMVTVLLVFYIFMMKWGMIQNRFYCASLMSAHILSCLLFLFTLPASGELTVIQEVTFMLNLGMAILFGVLLNKLIQRKQELPRLPKKLNGKSEIIDDIS